MKWKTVLFDWDGTLASSHEGIFYALGRTLAAHGLPAPDQTTLNSFIGPPIDESLQKMLGFSPEQAATLRTAYRKTYWDDGIEMVTAFPGVEAMLGSLQEKGVKIAIASAKMEPYVKRQVEFLGLSPYFDAIVGSSKDLALLTKPDLIRTALFRLGHTTGCYQSPQTAVMVGDREFDLLGAATVGLSGVGVLYGYGDRAELAACPQIALMETVADLSAFLQTEGER